MSVTMGARPSLSSSTDSLTPDVNNGREQNNDYSMTRAPKCLFISPLSQNLLLLKAGGSSPLSRRKT